jgi:hypothetical protein
MSGTMEIKNTIRYLVIIYTSRFLQNVIVS